MILRYRASNESWFPESEELLGAANSEGEAILPWARGFQNAPMELFSNFSNARERIDEGFFAAEIQEGEVSLGITIARDPAGNVNFLQAAHFFAAFVVFAEHVGEEFDAFPPDKTGSQGVVESKGNSNFLNPEFRAGGREDEGLAFVLLFLNFGEDFGVADFWKPLADKILGVLFEGVGPHFPEVGVENPLHAARAQDLIERKEGEEDGSEKPPERFTMKNKTPKHQLGVPRDDRLIEVVEDELFGLRHCKGNLRLV